jgi:VanZ family protein
MSPAVRRWAPSLLWAAVIFALSSRPTLPRLPGVLGWDKLQHTAGYLVGGVLLARALTGSRRGMAIAALLGLLYGVSDELHQLLVPGRNASVLDWCADALGIFLGIAAWRLTLHRLGRHARRRAPAREGRAAVTHA